MRDRWSQGNDAASFYLALAEAGLTYGPSFRGVRQLWRCNGEAFGQLQLPEALISEASSYQIHPALLDSCFPVFAAALPRPAADDQRAIDLPASTARLPP